MALRLSDLQKRQTFSTRLRFQQNVPVLSCYRCHLFAVATLEVLHKVGEFLNCRYAQGIID